jgi:hypothetical protein
MKKENLIFGVFILVMVGLILYAVKLLKETNNAIKVSKA